MEFKNLEKVLAGQPSFRIKQAKKAIFSDFIDDWEKATVFPMELRKRLNEEFPIFINALPYFSKDKKTVKVLLTLKDGLKVESVLIRHIDSRNTVCVSSQVGCSLGCSFCATGQLGFKRNLEAIEIVNQVLFFSRYLKKEKNNVTNVVFMGMGEPFLNYDNVIMAIRILNDKEGLNIGARHISVSTIGIIEGIENLANEKMQINLAISLHAPTNELRSGIIPANKKYPIEKILEAVDSYIKKTGRRVMFEYLLIKDVNDSEDCGRKVAKIMKKPLYFLNLILYNKTGKFSPSSEETVKRFKRILELERVSFSQRYKFGGEIKGACGQLVFEEGNDIIV